ncbi:MAG: DNA polymerase III subunit beta [Oscillochloris sp.]|nr:DNA polymerase III subunit beta [Oscillochloris sp.]
MKLTINQDTFKAGINIVENAVAAKSAMPILAHILLVARNGILKLAGTNLEVGITHWMQAEVTDEGAVTLPAKLLSDVVGNLPNAPVTLTLNSVTQTVMIACGDFKTNIKGFEAEEYPPIPTAENRGDALTFSAPEMAAAIRQVAFAAGSDDSRPVLTGVLFRITQGNLTLAAADGFRLATYTFPLGEPTRTVADLVIPARCVREVGTIAAATEGRIGMVCSPGMSQVIFFTEHTEVVSRLIDGKFPDFERIIPQQHSTRCEINTAALSKAVKLASYFTDQAIRLEMAPATMGGRITVSANASEVGDNTGAIDSSIAGDPGLIALNAKYVAEVLGAVGTKQVVIETRSAQSPAVIRPLGEGAKGLHVIMPMGIR